jgi:hypothetical protein
MERERDTNRTGPDSAERRVAEEREVKQREGERCPVYIPPPLHRPQNRRAIKTNYFGRTLRSWTVL